MIRVTAISARLMALASGGALVLAGCGGWGERPTPAPTVTVETTVSPVASNGDSTPTPTSEPTVATDDFRSPDPDAGVKPGDTVTPEFFISEVDQQNNEYLAVIYVRGIFETGGTCTVTVEGTRSSLTQENSAETDATGTACGSFIFPLNGLGSGEASVTASYESADYQGESDDVKVVLP